MFGIQYFFNEVLISFKFGFPECAFQKIVNIITNLKGHFNFMES